MSLLFFLLWTVGLTTILTEGKIFAHTRRWLQARFPSSFWVCPMCVGFWVGFFGQCVAPCPLLASSHALASLQAGFCVSYTAWFAYVLLHHWGSDKL